jgi:hypothetical protein
MALKLGQRVTIKDSVSNCMDAESKKTTRGDGVPRYQFVGMKGEVVQIGQDFLKVRVRIGTTSQLVEDAQNGPATVPPGCENMVLVDSQVVNGIREGKAEMREWFKEEELEVG